MPLSPDQQELLTRAVTDTVPHELAVEKLASGKKLRLYLGIDPTGAKLHIGHSVPLLKLRAFQDAGHHVIFLIGSFTAMIGDPTDRDSLREPLTREQVVQNFESYKTQAELILDFSKVELRYNHEWLDKMSFGDVIQLASHFTMQQMAQRDMFKKRISENLPIGVHEFLYPLMQGYDSVVLDVDFEVGGNDQLFNMLAGRTLQKAFGKRDKFVLTTKLIEGTDGRKMSKTYNNCVYITDAAEDMYGKIMSVQDNLIVTYFECCTRVALSEVEEIRKELESGTNPRDLKMRLAREIVTQYHSAEAATKAEEHFVNLFQKKQTPDVIEERSFAESKHLITDLIIAAGFATSKSDARRLVEGGGVELDGERIVDPKQEVTLHTAAVVLKVGKRHFLKVRQG